MDEKYVSFLDWLDKVSPIIGRISMKRGAKIPLNDEDEKDLEKIFQFYCLDRKV